MDQEARRIKASEWRQYRDLRLEALKDSPLAFSEQYDDSLRRPDKFWQDRVERGADGPTSAIFVAVRSGEFIGKAGCFVDADVTEHVSAHVVGVYVTPPFRGHGVAAVVVSAAVRWAREEARAARIRLFVTDGNDRAIALYRRIGFVLTGATRAYPLNPAYTELEMEHCAAT